MQKKEFKGNVTHMTKLQELIRAEMAARGLNQTTLARNAGLELSYIKNILLGKSTHPRIDKLQKLANYLNRPLSDFSEGNELYEFSKSTFQHSLPTPEEKAEVITRTNRRMYTYAVLVAKEALEKYGTKADTDAIDDLANRMCDAAIREETNIVTAELAEWLIDVMRKERE